MKRELMTAALVVASLFALPAAGADSKPAARAKQLSDRDNAETLLEVSVLHGSHEKKERDARIGNLPELREGPFAKYESYELLSRSELALRRGGNGQLRLPNGRLLEARLEEKLSDGSSRLIARILRPGAKDFLPLLEVKARSGQAFIVAGQNYRQGILVLVFRVLR